MTAPERFMPETSRRGWGRVVSGLQYVARPRFQDEIPRLCQAAQDAGNSVLAVGLGRSYGDVGANLDQAAVDMTALDRFIAFDAATGVLKAEAGASLDEVIRRVVPHGWFLPVTPGTRFATLGGCVANDVHGKNHHRAGTFGRFVQRLGLWRSDRGAVAAGPDSEPELFDATIGGLGLTGIILWVELQLIRVGSAYLDEDALPFGHLSEFFARSAESAAGYEHVVAWVDCTARGRDLGRGVLYRANWRHDGRLDAPPRGGPALPVDLPEFALNKITLKLFNTFYRGSQTPRTATPRHFGQVFHPLDSIRGWNRLYGRRGFFQHQSVVPPAAGEAAVAEMLEAIARAGEGSFLAVLKVFGDQPSPGLMSFPTPGVTLALDFAHRGETTLKLLSRLDDIAAAAGGRLYPAKDARGPARLWRAGYPNLERFTRSLDPAISSTFWRRMAHD